ncbi:MAG: hypothetical protein Q4A62_06275 [Eikenella sp.]|nr:hypothetical protein [Eikenella sp.]
MQQFTLSTPEGIHLGFIVFLPDEEYGEPPQSGVCMLRLQAADASPAGLPAGNRLQAWAEQALLWRVEGDTLTIYDPTGHPIADLRQQYLRWGGQWFVLSDLNGNL